MAIEPDELRERLTPELLAAILRENWHSHDARWFLKISAEHGFAAANRLNKATLRSMANTEMRRLLDAAGCAEVETVEDFATLANIACELYFPPATFEGKARATGEDSATGIVTRCFVFEEVSKAGVTDVYECACGIRHEGWLEACGFKGDVRIARSMMRGDPVCEVSATGIVRMSGGGT